MTWGPTYLQLAPTRSENPPFWDMMSFFSSTALLHDMRDLSNRSSKAFRNPRPLQAGALNDIGDDVPYECRVSRQAL